MKRSKNSRKPLVLCGQLVWHCLCHINHSLLHSIFIYLNLIGFPVGVYEVFKQRLFVVHRAREGLIIWTHLLFETDHIKVQLLTCSDSLDQLAKVVLAPASEENSQSIFLLHAEFYKTDLRKVSQTLSINNSQLLFVHSTTLSIHAALLYLLHLLLLPVCERRATNHHWQTDLVFVRSQLLTLSIILDLAEGS